MKSILSRRARILAPVACFSVGHAEAVSIKKSKFHKAMTTKGTPAEDEAADITDIGCECVNYGPNVWSAPNPTAENQKWLMATDATSDTIEDTPYGQDIMDDYGGPKDYGEYCHFWELAFPGTNDDCYTWKKDDPTYMGARWCNRPWCYIREKGTTGNQGVMSDDAPNCNGITLHKSGSLGGTYAGLSMWWSYDFCEKRQKAAKKVYDAANP